MRDVVAAIDDCDILWRRGGRGGDWQRREEEPREPADQRGGGTRAAGGGGGGGEARGPIGADDVVAGPAVDAVGVTVVRVDGVVPCARRDDVALARRPCDHVG